MTEFTSGSASGCVSPRPTDRSAPDADRRLLLRAAVSAPFLATIPSGAAFANASAFQCVVSSKTASDDGAAAVDRASQDNWVRLQVTKRPFGKLVGGKPTAKNGWLIDGIWYGDTGQAFDPQPNLSGTCNPANEWCPAGDPQQTLVLAIYKPLPDGVSPTSVTPAASGYNAFYPISSTQYDRPAQIGNIGLFVSCYCSVAPSMNPIDSVQRQLMTTYCNH